MIVIADTGPLNYLVWIDGIEVLPQLYQRVIVPPSVFMELGRSGAPQKVRRWIDSPPTWLESQAPTVVPDAELLIARLGPGESDAILLAQELGADELVLDERRGRREAERRRLHVIGTLGVLRLGAKEGLLNLSDALTRLRQTSFHVSDELIHQLLKEIGG